jgi:hypothetical protein
LANASREQIEETLAMLDMTPSGGYYEVIN